MRQKNLYNHIPLDCSAQQAADTAPVAQDPASSSTGLSKFYIFKSQLQEYAQKVGLPTPVYETIKEGPSHEPYFSSTVIVSGVRYDSLPGFSNRKASEQSAAEIALMELSKSGKKNETISLPVHETGLCKNLLQEYAQKQNYAIPIYTCKKEVVEGRAALYSCTVDIGGIKYIGTAARGKKNAEIKAARTALLSLQSSTSSVSDDLSHKSAYTVLPCKRKVTVTTPPQAETAKRKKPKNARLRKPLRKQKDFASEGNQVQAESVSVSAGNDIITEVATQLVDNDLLDFPVLDCIQTVPKLESSDQGHVSSEIRQHIRDIHAVEENTVSQVNYDSNPVTSLAEAYPVTDLVANNVASIVNEVSNVVAVGQAPATAGTNTNDRESYNAANGRCDSPGLVFGQTGPKLASSGQDIGSSEVKQHSTSASAVESNPVAQASVSHDSSQLTTSSNGQCDAGIFVPEGQFAYIEEVNPKIDHGNYYMPPIIYEPIQEPAATATNDRSEESSRAAE